MAAKATVARSIRLSPEADTKLRFLAAKLDISVNGIIQRLIDNLDTDSLNRLDTEDLDRIQSIFSTWANGQIDPSWRERGKENLNDRPDILRPSVQ